MLGAVQQSHQLDIVVTSALNCWSAAVDLALIAVGRGAPCCAHVTLHRNCLTDAEPDML